MPIEKLLGFRSRTFGISLTYFPKPPKKEVPRCIPTLSSGEWRDRSHIGATIWVSQPYDSYQNYNWTWIIYIYICWSQFWYIYIYICMCVWIIMDFIYIIQDTAQLPNSTFFPPSCSMLVLMLARRRWTESATTWIPAMQLGLWVKKRRPGGPQST